MISSPRLLLALFVAFAAGAPAMAGGGGDGDKKVAAPQTYVGFDRFTATLVDGYEIKGVIQVESGVDFKSSKQKRRAQAILPRIRAACGQAVRDFAVEEYIPGRAPNADLLAERMEQAAEAELGEDGAQVLLAAIIVTMN